jgi:hypothetical protein
MFLLLLVELVHHFLVGENFLFSGLSSGISGLVDQLLSSESGVSDQSLDFSGLLTFLAVLASPCPANHALLDDSDTIFFLVAEEFSQFAESLGSESSGDVDGGQSFDRKCDITTFNFGITFFHDGERQDSDIWSDDAASDGLLLLFSGPSWSVALLSFSHEDAHSAFSEDTLPHGETLFVVASSDLEDVSFELIPQ